MSRKVLLSLVGGLMLFTLAGVGLVGCQPEEATPSKGDPKFPPGAEPPKLGVPKVDQKNKTP